MPDPVPVPPGGERRDPREWTLYVCPECGVVDPARDGHYHDDRWVDSKLVRVVEASSVPVGGAPREKVADALYGHLGDFSTYEKCLELADAAIAAMRGSE